MSSRLNWEKANRRDLGHATITNRKWFPVDSRYDFTCEICGTKHPAGERAYYNAARPAGKKMRCRSCYAE